MNQALLVAWLALAAADRFDFLGGAGSFYLSPFLVLTPLVFVAEGLRLVARQDTLRFSEGAVHYLFWVICLLSLALLSVLFGHDVDMASRRYALWCVQVMAPFGVALLLAQYPEPERILVRGAYWGIGFGWLMNAIQIAIFASGSHVGYVEPLPFATLVPSLYAGIVPRLSMQVLDQNRAGMIFLIYLFILFRWAPPSRWRTVFTVLGILAMVSTSSRSVMLGGLALLGVHYLQKRRMRVTRRRIAALALAGTAAMAVVAANPEPVARFLEPVGTVVVGRLSLSRDESASIHFDLIAYGWEVATSKVKYALVGVGFGNAPFVLREFFEEDNANFHSFYITLLVECGAPALVLGVILLAFPALRSRTYRPLLVGLAAFNVFYQLNTEPLFWFVVAAAWMGLAVPAVRAAHALAPAPGAALQPHPAEAVG